MKRRRWTPLLLRWTRLGRCCCLAIEGQEGGRSKIGEKQDWRIDTCIKVVNPKSSSCPMNHTYNPVSVDLQTAGWMSYLSSSSHNSIQVRYVYGACAVASLLSLKPRVTP